MTSGPIVFRVAAFCAIAACSPRLAPAQMNHEHHAAGMTDNKVVTVGGLKIPDTLLENQRGEKVHFYSDLVNGKTVAINTIFTTCTTICPLMGANFSRLRKLLAGKPGIDLISISIDPAVDTPQRLDQWSRSFGEMGPGWTLVTGNPPDVIALLKALQVFTPDKADHSPVVLVGNDAGADWSRASALMPVPQLADLILSRGSH